MDMFTREDLNKKHKDYWDCNDDDELMVKHARSGIIAQQIFSNKHLLGPEEYHTWIENVIYMLSDEHISEIYG